MDVGAILNAGKGGVELKPTTVDHADDIDVDVGLLFAQDKSALDLERFKENTAEYLAEISRDTAQVLVNAVFDLPAVSDEDGIMACLPPVATVLPREKPIPAKKAMSKWEEFARDKGIQKNKRRSRMVWDEDAKDWKPRWGYKRANDDTNDWLIEHKDSDDLSVNPFTKRKQEKKERVAKNKMQEQRNIARAIKKSSSAGASAAGAGTGAIGGGARSGASSSAAVVKAQVPNSALSAPKTTTGVQLKAEIEAALASVRKSTASVGKFDKRLPNEKKLKVKGVKRKFDPAVGPNLAEEKEKSIKVLDKMFKGKETVLNVEKAARSAKVTVPGGTPNNKKAKTAAPSKAAMDRLDPKQRKRMQMQAKKGGGKKRR